MVKSAECDIKYFCYIHYAYFILFYVSVWVWVLVLYFSIHFTLIPPAWHSPRRPRRSKQPPIDTSSFVASACLTAPDLDKRSPQFRIAHVQHLLKAGFPVWGKTMYHEVNKSYFDMTKVLPLSRWKKQKFPERNAFSDEEDSDEEDSEYEHKLWSQRRISEQSESVEQIKQWAPSASNQN